MLYAVVPKHTKHILKYQLVTDEPLFTQNDRLCAPDSTQEGSIASCSVLPSRLMFTKSVTVSVAVSASSSAIAEGPRDALSHLKSCQLLHNCTKNHVTRRIALSCGIKISPRRSVLWISHKARVTDGQTDGQNYDSQDRASIAASRGKNASCF